jgi:hypothetical protein
LKELVKSDFKAVDGETKRACRILLLFLFALFGPFLIGYQYLEWFHSSSSHMTWLIATGIGVIENSDWTGNAWFLRTVFLSGEMDPIGALVFLAIFLLPRLLFAAAVTLHELGRLGKTYVGMSAIPVIVVTIWLILNLTTLSLILGVPPGILISIAAPDVDSRFFLPTPILLVLGFFIIRSKRKE